MQEKHSWEYVQNVIYSLNMKLFLTCKLYDELLFKLFNCLRLLIKMLTAK